VHLALKDRLSLVRFAFWQSGHVARSQQLLLPAATLLSRSVWVGPGHGESNAAERALASVRNGGAPRNFHGRSPASPRPAHKPAATCRHMSARLTVPSLATGLCDCHSVSTYNYEPHTNAMQWPERAACVHPAPEKDCVSSSLNSSHVAFALCACACGSNCCGRGRPCAGHHSACATRDAISRPPQSANYMRQFTGRGHHGPAVSSATSLVRARRRRPASERAALSTSRSVVEAPTLKRRVP
jgi:hypothetical protein